MVPFPKGGILLAPMVGITNRAFRQLVFELGGPDYCFTEMASVDAYRANAQFEAEYTDPSPEPEKTSIQFFAKNPESLAAACEKLMSLPEAQKPMGIDINMGCSAPHIRKAGSGSAWGSDPEGAAALVSAARKVWPSCLSAKIRLGVDEDYGRLLEFGRAISEAGLDFLTIHPRGDSQKFRRKPHHELGARLAADLPVPLVASGDIVDAAGYRSILEGSSVYAAMIGREAIRKPWIFAELKAELRNRGDGPKPEGPSYDRQEIGLRFIELAESRLPYAWRIHTCRRFFEYFCEPLSFAHSIKYKLLNRRSLSEMRAAFVEYFARVPSDRFAPSNRSPTA